MNHKADKRYGFEYSYGGSMWVGEVWADDELDAQRKVRAMATNGRVIGEIKLTFRVPGPIERVLRWLGSIGA